MNKKEHNDIKEPLKNEIHSQNLCNDKIKSCELKAPPLPPKSTKKKLNENIILSFLTKEKTKN